MDTVDFRHSTAEVRKVVLEKLTTHKQMTADEIAKSLGFSILLVRPCVCDLHINKVIRKSGLKRANASGIKANVWELAA